MITGSAEPWVSAERQTIPKVDNEFRFTVGGGSPGLILQSTGAVDGLHKHV
jgi:hypothetical protein